MYDSTNSSCDNYSKSNDRSFNKIDIESANKDVMDECEKIQAMTEGPKYVNFHGKPLPTGKLPPNYICHRCGEPGHWIQNCPTIKIGPDGRPIRSDNLSAIHAVKRSYGIPNSFLQPVMDPNQPGAVLTRDGFYAVPVIDAEAYQRGKKEKPPFVENDQKMEKLPEDEPIPPELLCPVCSKLIDDAVVLPCCHEPVCDKCAVCISSRLGITEVLLSSDQHRCPLCKQTHVSPCQLLPNNFLRKKVKEYGSLVAKNRYLQLISTNRPPVEVVRDAPNKPQTVYKRSDGFGSSENSTGISKAAVDTLISQNPSLALPSTPMMSTGTNMLQMNPMFYFQQHCAMMQQFSQPQRPRLLSREEFYALQDKVRKTARDSDFRDRRRSSSRSHKKRRSSSRRRDRSRERRSRREKSRNQLDDVKKSPGSVSTNDSRRDRRKSRSKSPRKSRRRRRRSSSSD